MSEPIQRSIDAAQKLTPSQIERLDEADCVVEDVIQEYKIAPKALASAISNGLRKHGFSEAKMHLIANLINRAADGHTS